MAKLEIANTAKLPFGRDFLVCGTIVGAGAAAADEYISANDLGLSDIVSAGVTPIGATVYASAVQLNAVGTGAAAGSSPGNLGVEVEGACSLTFWAIGRGNRGVANRKVASA